MVSIDQDISIVIPVYNEASVIEEVIRGFYSKVIANNPSAKFIIAEDGSTDGTKEILQRLNRQIPFQLISGAERKGYTKAFKDALRIATTQLIFFSDSDGQQDPSDIFKLLKEIGDNDIVSGYKLRRRDPLHRILISRVYNFLIYLLFGLRMKDIDSGFKLIRKEVIDTILADVTEMKYCVMSEFILKAYLAGYKIKEIAVSHYPRQSGATAIFKPIMLPGIVLGLIRNLLRIRSNYSRRVKR